MEGLSDQALTQVAQYFQALADPTRLRILNTLRDGESNVGTLTDLCGCSTANVSRHLSALANQGMVVREGRGTSVFYRIADESIYSLCDLVCGSIARQIKQQAGVHRAFGAVARKKTTAARQKAR
jgi:DNA-binding transcriptional ArsR family regulator